MEDIKKEGTGGHEEEATQYEGEPADINDHLGSSVANGVSETSLHISVFPGQLDFVVLLLNRKEEYDYKGYQSIIPLGFTRGRFEIVEELRKIDPELCFVRFEAAATTTPLLQAARKGQMEVLQDLIPTNPEAIDVVMLGRHAVLHVTVKHKHLNKLTQLLSSVFSSNQQPIGSTDTNDSTILHFVEQKRRQSRGSKDLKNAHKCNCSETISKINNRLQCHWNEVLSALMVVAILIATVTCQAGLSPPGGFWQGDSNQTSRVAGTSILADVNPLKYHYFILYNTIGFSSSVFAIELLILGLLTRYSLLLWITLFLIWISLNAISAVYFTGVTNFTLLAVAPICSVITMIFPMLWNLPIVCALWRRLVNGSQCISNSKLSRVLSMEENDSYT